MKTFLLKILLITLFILVYPKNVSAADTIWEIQSVDTMKYSRDAARDPSTLKLIPIHVKAVSDLGANYIAISTPYDDEFTPFLKSWVDEARKNNLKVWFRGNFSGWEGWFGYKKLSSTEEHNTKTYRFITQNQDLFRDGDIFTPAPEPENGILGDPRRTGRHEEFNNFLQSSFTNCKNAFEKINKKVNCGVWSMNTDVLRETVTRETIAKMGGIISIDHYTKTPEKLIEDVKNLNNKFHAKVVLGEFGAPIPDINGTMSDFEQSQYIEGVLENIYENRKIILGANYWVLAGGSTSLLTTNHSPKQAISSLRKYFDPSVITGRITDGVAKPISGATVYAKDKNAIAKTDSNGKYKLLIPFTAETALIVAEKKDYKNSEATVRLSRGGMAINLILEPEKEGIMYKIQNIIQDIFN